MEVYSERKTLCIGGKSPSLIMRRAGSFHAGGGYWDNSKCYAQVSALAFAKTYGKGDGAWKMKVNCRTFMLTYKMSSVSSFGKADLYVDGMKKTTMNSYDKSGWNNGTVYVAIQEEKRLYYFQYGLD